MKKGNGYTRTGDQGLTSLVGGKRVPKASLRLDSYGTIDELNSQLGLLLTYLNEPSDCDCLVKIQCQLFAIGSILATDPDSAEACKCKITEDDVIELEHCIDRAGEGLPGWRGFTLPGGCRTAAVAHVCRCVCRRAERIIYALDAKEPVDKNVTAYINRLSDYLYVLACRLNFLGGTDEILWHKG